VIFLARRLIRRDTQKNRWEQVLDVGVDLTVSPAAGRLDRFIDDDRLDVELKIS
jgi:hypothetical protein